MIFVVNIFFKNKNVVKLNSKTNLGTKINKRAKKFPN